MSSIPHWRNTPQYNVTALTFFDVSLKVEEVVTFVSNTNFHIDFEYMVRTCDHALIYFHYAEEWPEILLFYTCIICVENAGENNIFRVTNSRFIC
jgi:hypothetical protein